MIPQAAQRVQRPGPVSPGTGIGLRAQHHQAVVDTHPAVGWLEAHSENYFPLGGAQPGFLERIRADYPLSLHGVGLSLGSTEPLDRAHLSHLERIVAHFEPALVSEHLSWGRVGGTHFNDLLPLPYTEEALRLMVERVREVQDHLGRQILIENVSSYLEYADSSQPEWEFLSALAAESECGLLLDVNNVYVSAHNLGFSAEEFLAGIPVAAVKEIHLAGHSRNRFGDRDILVDTHGTPVCDDVWALYAAAVRRFGDVPTLIEWDTDIPALDVLLAEARKADTIREQAHALAA